MPITPHTVLILSSLTAGATAWANVDAPTAAPRAEAPADDEDGFVRRGFKLPSPTLGTVFKQNFLNVRVGAASPTSLVQPTIRPLASMSVTMLSGSPGSAPIVVHASAAQAKAW